MNKQRPESLLTLVSSHFLRLFNLFTTLVSYRAGSLTCGLAGSLALATAALFHGFL